MKAKFKFGIFDIFGIFIMFFICVVMLYPFYYMFIYSISDPLEAARGVFLLPRGITSVNYVMVLRNSAIYQGLLVSISRTVIGTAITVFCSSAFAYLLTKEELPYRRFFYRMLVVTMYVSGGLIPWFLTMVAYGLQNNFLLYVIPTAVGAFNVVLIRTYIMEAIPKSLEESAVIDGAGIVTVFLKIILPLTLPVLAAVAVFAAVGQWNSWTDNLFLVSDPRLKTLQLILYETLIRSVPKPTDTTRTIMETFTTRPTNTSIRMTVSIVTILPIFLVYPLLQRYFIKGLMIGAIKG